MNRETMIAAGIGAGLVLVWLIGRSKSGGDASVAENIGRGTVDAAIGVGKGAASAVVDAIKGAGKAASDAVFPADKCVKALQSRDEIGAAWHCSPGTFADWLTSGRPTACYLMNDGKIYCARGWSAGGASGTW